MLAIAHPRARVTAVQCRASSSKPNPVANFVRSFADKRSKASKDHLSRLYMIGAADYKELTEFVEDLDKMHKKAFQDLKTKMTSEQAPATSATTTSSDSSDSSIFNDDA